MLAKEGNKNKKVINRRTALVVQKDKSSCSALMDLCDEADTANDGKISIQEYLTITKNYGIKVALLCNINQILGFSLFIS